MTRKMCCHIDGCMEDMCVLDPAYMGPPDDCAYGPDMLEAGGKEHCEHWKSVPEPVPSKFQKAAALVREALDLVEEAFDAGMNHEHGIPQSEAREAIRQKLEALEKES